jgi:uncharacterized protein YdhG (YjbR/CyaY superfamily)
MMEKIKVHFGSVDEYLNSHNGETRERLETICNTIKQIAPDSEARISYNMPAFYWKGRLVYFCAFKKHIGFYPASMAVFHEFASELKEFKQSGRGTIQFPYTRPIPVELIKKIVQFRIKENEENEFKQMEGDSHEPR